MIEPKFKYGDEVHVMGIVNRTSKIADRVHEPENRRSNESGYRYKVADSRAWFYEHQLESPLEVEARLAELDDDPPAYEYDADSGCAFIRGQWVVVCPSQAERFRCS